MNDRIKNCDLVRFAIKENGAGYKMESYVEKRLGLTPGRLLTLW